MGEEVPLPAPQLIIIKVIIIKDEEGMVNRGYYYNDPVLTRELSGVVAKEVNLQDNSLGTTDKVIVFPTGWGNGATEFLIKAS